MKKIVYSLLLVLYLSVLGACARATAKQADGMINPGDEVDGMLFTTTDEVDWDFSLSFLCDFSSWDDTANRTVPCFTMPGSSVFFGNYSGVGYDNPEEAVEEWRK